MWKWRRVDTLIHGYSLLLVPSPLWTLREYRMISAKHKMRKTVSKQAEVRLKNRLIANRLL